MLKDNSWPGSRSSSLRLEKAFAIILLFLILLGWSSLCPVSLGTQWVRAGTRDSPGTGDTQPQALETGAWGPSPVSLFHSGQGHQGLWTALDGSLGIEVSHKQDTRHLQSGRGHPIPKPLSAASPQLTELTDKNLGMTSNTSGCWKGQEGSHEDR